MRRGAVLGTAIALSVVVAMPPAAASHVQARSTDDACARAPEDGFTDTGTPGSAGEQAVDCIVWYGITSGTSQNRYSPGRTITRGQLATMVAQLMRSSETAFDEPSPSEDFFSDDDGNLHEDNINFVAKHGVVRGVDSNRFSPDSGVRRDQMASFVAGVIEAIGAPVPSTTADYFPDDDTSVHERNINGLAALGVVTGRTSDLYEPALPVTRLQMAFFLSRAADYLVEEELLIPPDRRLFVTLDDSSIEQGGALSGSVNAGSTILSARVGGCGFSNELLEDRAPTEPGVQFEETLSASQPTGACTLTFTATFTDGSTQSRSIGVTVLGAQGEAVPGSHTSVDVVSVDRGGNSFLGATDQQGHPQERFDYDTNDTFRFGVTAISLAQFEGLLTGPGGGVAGDVLDAFYASEPSGTSIFTVTTDRVPAASDVNARVQDLDSDHRKDDVRITWTASAQPDAIYDVFRDDPVTDNGTIGPEDGAAVASDVAGTGAQAIDQPAGTYDYLVRAKSSVTAAQSPVSASGNVTVRQ